MKKAVSLVLSLVAAVGLSACVSPPTAPPSESSGEAAASQADPHDLRFLQTGSEAGRYGIVSRSDYSLLCYIDYSSACDTPLCAQPSCPHNSESCTAYIPGGQIISSLYALDDRSIAFIVTAAPTEDKGSILYITDSSGENRRKIFQAESGQDFWEITCADDQYLYFPMQTYQAEESQTRLYRVALSGGEPEPLFDCSDSQILGVSGRDLVCHTSHYDQAENVQPPEIPENASQEEINRLTHEYLSSCTGTHTLYLLNIDDGTQRELDSWTSNMDNEDRALLWQDNRLYWCDTGWNRLPQSVHWIEPDGQTGEVAVAWPDALLQEVENDPNETAGISRFEGVVENRALLRVTGRELRQSRYAVDLSDGSAAEIPLLYESNGKEQPVSILGRSADSLLVEMEMQMDEVTYIQKDGTPTTNGAAVGRYSLISFADFLAGKPAYREIDTQYVETLW